VTGAYAAGRQVEGGPEEAVVECVAVGGHRGAGSGGSLIVPAGVNAMTIVVAGDSGTPPHRHPKSGLRLAVQTAQTEA
jgi:hypothetical protein